MEVVTAAGQITGSRRDGAAPDPAVPLTMLSHRSELLSQPMHAKHPKHSRQPARRCRYSQGPVECLDGARCCRPTPRSDEPPLTQTTPALVVLHPCGAHHHRHGWRAPPRAPRPRYARTTCAMGGGGTRVHRVPGKLRVYVMRARASSLSLGRRAFFTMAIVPLSGWATPSCPKKERENRQNAECSKSGHLTFLDKRT